MKRCSRCLKDKDESEFYKTQWIRGGLIEWCRDCRKEYGAQYWEKNKDRIKEYREENRERIAEKKREWIDRNRERVRQLNRESYYRRKERAQQNFSGC